jgi:hypothetical protein
MSHMTPSPAAVLSKPSRSRFGVVGFCVALAVNAYRSNNRSSVNSQTR